MKKLLVISGLSFLFYLLLTAGSGPLLLWSPYELIFGLLVALLVGIVAYPLPLEEPSLKVLNPLRLLLFLIYLLGPFFLAMSRANLDVAYRVITGKINPGIVKVSTELKTDLGLTLLANSITLTPGTLTVEVDKKNNLYIHWITIKDKEPKAEEVVGNLLSWVRKITE